MKKLLITAIIMLILICVAAGSVQAVYQSSPNSSAVTATTPVWLQNVRKMEASGRVMGLTESLASTSTLLPSGSNNIDVHLQRNTEYGAMLILAVSDYGKQGNGTADSDHINNSTYGLATTTGNKSGIYNVGNALESVAAGYPENDASDTTGHIYWADTRYYDKYEKTKSSKPGDAINIYTWQAGTGQWFINWGAGNPRSQFYLARKAFSHDSLLISTAARSHACIVNGAGF